MRSSQNQSGDKGLSAELPYPEHISRRIPINRNDIKLSISYPPLDKASVVAFLLLQIKWAASHRIINLLRQSGEHGSALHVRQRQGPKCLFRRMLGRKTPVRQAAYKARNTFQQRNPSEGHDGVVDEIFARESHVYCYFDMAGLNCLS